MDLRQAQRRLADAIDERGLALWDLQLQPNNLALGNSWYAANRTVEECVERVNKLKAGLSEVA